MAKQILKNGFEQRFVFQSVFLLSIFVELYVFFI